MKREPRLRQMTAAALCMALGPAGNALAEESTSGREISIVVEEGDKVPVQALDALAEQELGAGTTADVTFSVIEGQARLINVDGQTADAASGGAVAHPEIIAGPHYEESYVQMLADGKPIGKAVRIGTIASGSLDQLLAKDVPAGSKALLARSSEYAVVDTGLLRSQTPVDSKEGLSGQYCAGIFDKERDVYGRSRVIAEACSDRSQEDAFAQAQSTAMFSDAGINFTVLLMRFYEHADWGGHSYGVFGCCGDCDTAGYVIETASVEKSRYPYGFYWHNNLSSIGWNNGRCRYTRYKAVPFDVWGPLRTLPDWYVGDTYNDFMYAVKVWSPG